jgi:hypothetical protein
MLYTDPQNTSYKILVVQLQLGVDISTLFGASGWTTRRARGISRLHSVQNGSWAYLVDTRVSFSRSRSLKRPGHEVGCSTPI